MRFFGLLMGSVGLRFGCGGEEGMMIDVWRVKNGKLIYGMIYWVMNLGVMIGGGVGGWFLKRGGLEVLIGRGIGGFNLKFLPLCRL